MIALQTTLLMLALAAPSPQPSAPVDVVIGAGHEGRPASCAQYPTHQCNMGTAGEIVWTPIVADEATRVLRAHGVSVARIPADFPGRYDVAAAVFIHFDGNDQPCSTGASIGYRNGAANRAAADAWRAYYSRLFPFTFMPDNFTGGLHHYYAYRQVRGEKGVLVLELAEITCPKQRAWVAPRLTWEGDVIAHFISQLIDKGDVPDPGPFK